MNRITLAALVLLVAGAAVPAAQDAEGDADTDISQDEGLPLATDRTVYLDLTEGTWISLDVSPDGEAIVFDYLGDLFTIPFSGGTATQLTSDLAFDAQPRFSPDGTRIVYTSDHSGSQNIWIRSLDGKDAVQVSKGSTSRAESPDWMPDGTYVVASIGQFRLGDLPKVRLFHVDGGSGTELPREGVLASLLDPKDSR